MTIIINEFCCDYAKFLKTHHDLVDKILKEAEKNDE